MTTASDHIGRYAEHARRLQVWIGAYGAGLGSLIVLNFRTALASLAPADAISERIWAGADVSPIDQNYMFEARHAAAAIVESVRFALACVAVALAAQVLLLLINKITQFYVAHADEFESEQSWCEKSSIVVSRWIWLDICVDSASICLLAIATIKGIGALGTAVLK